MLLSRLERCLFDEQRVGTQAWSHFGGFRKLLSTTMSPVHVDKPVGFRAHSSGTKKSPRVAS